MGILSDDINKAIAGFKKYNEEENKDEFIDDVVKTRFIDEEARKVIKKAIEGEITDIKSLSKQQRDVEIAKVKAID